MENEDYEDYKVAIQYLQEKWMNSAKWKKVKEFSNGANLKGSRVNPKCKC